MDHTRIQPCPLCSKHILKTLVDVARIAASNISQENLIHNILESLETNLGLIRGTVTLLSPDNRELVTDVVRHSGAKTKTQVRYRRGEGILGSVLETGKSRVIPSVSNEPSFMDRIHKRFNSLQTLQDFSFICVPVIVNQDVVGTLSVDLPMDKKELLEQNEEVITIVAGIIANHLNSQRMHQLERELLQKENERLRSELREKLPIKSIIGVSPQMQEVMGKIHILAQSDTTAIIRGASGTGKELVAAAIHYNGNRKEGPFIRVNCAALNENILESELFGHEKGAFTGALHTRIGRIQEAEGGTLFLDEIGEFSPAIQTKLLRVLQEHQYERVGSNKTLCANIRLITATNRDLEEMIEVGRFREDLYYRIHVFPIHLPPLCERKEDILPIANHFISKYSKKMNKEVHRINTTAINMLMSYHWPGNVRELENCIEYSVLLSSDGVVYGHNLPPTLQVPVATTDLTAMGLVERVKILEKDMINDALKRTEGNMTAAAKELGVSLRVIRYKIETLGIRISD